MIETGSDLSIYLFAGCADSWFISLSRDSFVVRRPYYLIAHYRACSGCLLNPPQQVTKMRRGAFEVPPPPVLTKWPKPPKDKVPVPDQIEEKGIRKRIHSEEKKRSESTERTRRRREQVELEREQTHPHQEQEDREGLHTITIRESKLRAREEEPQEQSQRLNNPRSSSCPGDVDRVIDRSKFKNSNITHSTTTDPLFGITTKLDEHKYDEDKLPDLTPVSSLYFDSNHLSLSFGHSQFKRAADRRAIRLLQDKITQMYEEVSEALKAKADQVERNYARLLVKFTVDLVAEANSILEIRVVQVIKSRAKYVAHFIGKHLDLSKEALSQKMYEVVLESPRKVAEQSSLGNLEGVKDFILTSSALVKLRESFRLFIFHGKSQGPASRVRHPHMPLGQPDLDIWPDEGMDTDTGSVDLLEPNVNLIKQQLKSERLGSPLAFIMLLLRWCRIVAEFLELKETPLAPGFTRVRWTCVSKHMFPNQRVMQRP